MKTVVTLALCLSLSILTVARAMKPSHALSTIAKTDRNGSVNMSEAEEEEVAPDEDIDEDVAFADDDGSMEDASDDDGEDMSADDEGEDDAGTDDDSGGDDRANDDGD